ncbi:chemosensory protein [Rhyzopertha dominica]|nr:chemosensory protein [Rhyzopertha dominica]
MQPTPTFLCVVATFVLMYDHQKLVGARSVNDRGARVTRDVAKYTTKYDNIDVDRILSSQRLLRNYANCLLDKGPCTPEGKELKAYLPDAIATECVKCSEAQKKIAGKVFSHLLQDHRQIWDELIAKYDPDGNFRKKYGIDEDEDYQEENQ